MDEVDDASLNRDPSRGCGNRIVVRRCRTSRRPSECGRAADRSKVVVGTVCPSSSGRGSDFPEKRLLSQADRNDFPVSHRRTRDRIGPESQAVVNPSTLEPRRWRPGSGRFLREAIEHAEAQGANFWLEIDRLLLGAAEGPELLNREVRRLGDGSSVYFSIVAEWLVDRLTQWQLRKSRAHSARNGKST